MIRVGIIEDNKALRVSLELLISRSELMTCVLSLNSLLHIVSEIMKHKPDVIMLDIGLPNISGIEGVKLIKEHFPDIQIMMFTVFEEEDKIFDAIKFGASGYLLKSASPNEITDAILGLFQGGAPMTASIAKKVIQSFQAKPTIVSHESYGFTAREKEILFALKDGMSYQKIANQYAISISTVRTHITNIYAKLHVNSKAEAVAKILKK